jgi:hypothetical protein
VKGRHRTGPRSAGPDALVALVVGREGRLPAAVHSQLLRAPQYAKHVALPERPSRAAGEHEVAGCGTGRGRLVLHKQAASCRGSSNPRSPAISPTPRRRSSVETGCWCSPSNGIRSPPSPGSATPACSAIAGYPEPCASSSAKGDLHHRQQPTASRDEQQRRSSAPSLGLDRSSTARRQRCQASQQLLTGRPRRRRRTRREPVEDGLDAVMERIIFVEDGGAVE